MNLQEMIDAVNRRVDDVVSSADAIEWLNSGKDKMATAAEAQFPDMKKDDVSKSYPFPSKYHETVVLYAAACMKEQDTAMAEVQNFMRKFEEGKKEFVENYKVPPRYWDKRTVQQFVAVAAQTIFTITDPDYNPTYGDLKVFVNDLPRTDFTVNMDNTFTFPVTVVLAAGDAVTAQWEDHYDMQEPPYSWWKGF